MVQLRVGDTVTVCTAIWDFCPEAVYFINDINISNESCVINADVPQCLNLSGVQVEFQWTNGDGIYSNNCDPTKKLKTLGTAITDINGVASISYTIVPEDLLYYQNNTIFDIRVCITNKTSSEVINFGANRLKFHSGDKIEIIQSCTPNWQCEQPLNGYENDGCGNRRLNINCDPSHLECVNNICTRISGYGTDTCTTENANCTTSYVKTIEAYFQPSRMIPSNVIYSMLNSMYYGAYYLLPKYDSNYYVKDINFNSDSYIITLTIEIINIPQLNTQTTLSSPPGYPSPLLMFLSSLGHLISWLFGKLLGTKETYINTPLPNTRTINLIPIVCSVDTGGIETCLSDSDKPTITATYTIDGILNTIISIKGSQITITIDSNKSTEVTFKVDGHSYVRDDGKSTYNIPTGTENILDNIKFLASGFAPPSPPVNVTGCSGIGGYEYRYSDDIELIKNGTYDITKSLLPNLIIEEGPDKGKDYKPTAGRQYCLRLFPSENGCVSPEPACFTAVAGVTPPTTTIVTSMCDTVKNRVNINVGYKNQNGFMEYLLPKDITDVTITPPTGIERVDIDNKIFYVLGKLENNVTYTVNITVSNYTVLDNNQTVIFNTDFSIWCPGSKSLTFETQARPSTYDVTFTIKNKFTKLPIQNAVITSSDGLVEYCKSGTSGLCLINGLSPRTYSLIVTHSLYKSESIELVLDSPKMIEVLLDIKDQSGVFGKIDVTHKIERASIVGGDDEIIINVQVTNNSTSPHDYKVKLFDEIGTEVESTSCTNLIAGGSLPAIFDSNWKLWSLKTLGKKYNITLYICEPDNVIRYADSKTINFTLTELNPCCFTLPLIGCISSQTCKNVKTGAIVAGAGLLIYYGLKTVKSLSPSK